MRQTRRRKNYEVINPDSVELSKHANTFRVSHTETDLLLDFGRFIASENGETVIKLISSVSLPTNLVKDLVFAMFNTARKYEKEYNKDIGFSRYAEDDTEKQL